MSPYEDHERLSEENGHLRKLVRELQDENVLIRGILEPALARLRLPDIENDGGPGDLTETIDTILHNSEAYLDEIIELESSLAEQQAVVEAARGKCQNIISWYEHSKYILDADRQTALDVASEILCALDGEP
jgi:hypothetical protein